MISCAEAVRLLWEYLDDTIDPAGPVDRVSIDAHLARCRRCCGELEFAKQIQCALARAANEDVPDEILRRLNSTLEELQP